MGMSADEAVTYNPHGFRHVLVSAGQQFRHYDVIKEDDLEVIGHWEKGSCIPRKYDHNAGVIEMRVRIAVLQQLRLGWRPSADGSLPTGPIASPSERVPVGHRGMKRVHVWGGNKQRTRCKMWTCGMPSDPGPEAQFDNIPVEWERCRQCV